MAFTETFVACPLKSKFKFGQTRLTFSMSALVCPKKKVIGRLFEMTKWRFHIDRLHLGRKKNDRK